MYVICALQSLHFNCYFLSARTYFSTIRAVCHQLLMKVLLGDNYFNYYIYVKITALLKTHYPFGVQKINSPSYTQFSQESLQSLETKTTCRSWEMSVASRKHRHGPEYILLEPGWTNSRTVLFTVCILFLNDSKVSKIRQTLLVCYCLFQEQCYLDIFL